MRKKRFLAVDQGNSFFKLSLFQGERLEAVRRIPTDAVEDIFTLIECLKPDCGAFCSVGKIDSRIVESLRLSLDGNLLILSHSTPLPIEIEYSTPSTLGLDRIALAAGAAATCGVEGLVVADAGTAVTLDVVMPRDKQGASSGQPSPTFVGGRISPGVWLRFESLHQFTSALPMVEAVGPLPLAGYSTETSIRSGVVLGLADEIAGTFSQYQESFGCSRLLLTGGDAHLLIKLLSSRIPAVHEPDLMAKGLLYIYNYNEI